MSDDETPSIIEEEEEYDIPLTEYDPLYKECEWETGCFVPTDYQKLIIKDKVEKVASASDPDRGFDEYYDPIGRWVDSISDIELACKYGAIKCFKYFQERGDTLSDCMDWTIFGQCKEIVNILEENGFKVPNNAIKIQLRVLDAYQGHFNKEFFKWLVEEKGCEVTVEDAVVGDVDEIAKILIERGEEISDMCLSEAIINKYKNNSNIYDLLIKHGCNLDGWENCVKVRTNHDAYNMGGRTPLSIALEHDDKELAKRLLDLGANPYAYDQYDFKTGVSKYYYSGMSILPMNDDYFEILVTDAIIENDINKFNEVMSTGFKPKRKLRGIVSLLKSKDMAKALSIYDLYEVSEDDIEIISTNKHTKKFSYLFEANDQRPKTYTREPKYITPKSEEELGTFDYLCQNMYADNTLSIISNKWQLLNPEQIDIILQKALRYERYKIAVYIFQHRDIGFKVRGSFSPILYAAAYDQMVYEHQKHILRYILDNNPDLSIPDSPIVLSNVFYTNISRMIDLGFKPYYPGHIPDCVGALILNNRLTAFELLKYTNDFTKGFYDAINSKQKTYMGFKINYDFFKEFHETFPPKVYAEIINFLIDHFDNSNEWIDYLVSLKPEINITFNPKLKRYEVTNVSDEEYLYMLGQENIDALNDYFKIKGTVMLNDWRAPYEADFNHNKKCVLWLIKNGLELNPKDRPSPAVITCRPGMFSNAERARIYIRHGCNPRIEFKGESSLANSYRALATFGYGSDRIFKTIALIRKYFWKKYPSP